MWLAVAGMPVFFQPFPQAADHTATIALASGRIGWRSPCLSLRCPGHEWRRPSAAETFAHREDPATATEPLLPGALPFGMPALSAPVSAQVWSSNYVNDLGIGTSFGLNPLRTPDTDVRMSFGPALRLQPYVDDGTARPGPVARLQVRISQKLGDRVRLTQRASIENGVANTFVRNSIGLDVFLHPQWLLDSDLETTHDSVPDGKGVTDTRGSVKLRYNF